MPIVIADAAQSVAIAFYAVVFAVIVVAVLAHRFSIRRSK